MSGCGVQCIVSICKFSAFVSVSVCLSRNLRLPPPLETEKAANANSTNSRSPFALFQNDCHVTIIHEVHPLQNNGKWYVLSPVARLLCRVGALAPASVAPRVSPVRRLLSGAGAQPQLLD